MLLLVVALTGVALVFVWLNGSAVFVAGAMLLYCAAQSWDERHAAGTGSVEPDRRDHRVPMIVVLVLAAGLLAWSAVVDHADDQVWATVLKIIVALAAAGLAARIGARLRRR